MDSEKLVQWGDDTFKMLAWLDYCLEKQIDFRATVQSYLKDVTGKEVKESQVLRKLKTEWTGSGDTGSKTSHDLLIQGSKVLSYYDEDERAKIHDAYSRIVASNRVWSPRLASQRYTSQASGTPDISHEQTDARLADRTDTELQHSDSGDAGCRRETNTVETVVESPQSSRSASTLSYPNTQPRNCVYVQAATQTFEAENLEILVNDLQQQLEPREEQVALSDSASAAEAHKDNYAIQRDLRIEISHLKRKRQSREEQKKSIEKVQTDSLGSSIEIIREDFDHIQNAIMNALSSTEPAALTSISTSYWDNATIEVWARRATGSSFPEMVDQSIKDDIMELDVARSLAAVGLCNIVFESSFPHPYLLATESPLLDQYRKNISMQDGPHALLRIDLLAHESLISGKYFQDTILEESAWTLATRLYDSLKALNSPGDDITGDPMSLTSSAELGSVTADSIVSPAVDGFQLAFRKALWLKSNLILSTKKYKVVFFSPGDTFNRETMYLDGEVPDYSAASSNRQRPVLLGQAEDRQIHRIKLCVFPALYSTSSYQGHTGVMSDRSQSKQSVVEYCNFIHAENSQSWEGFDLVVKAVVLV
ncbi:hypothetical protein GQ53DRAFT_835712 [Thozetella sp. PMI_491]|nr:hypothetical protein GQ53DRAFT_835712 [Thozetella sp. PMI_491]